MRSSINFIITSSYLISLSAIGPKLKSLNLKNNLLFFGYPIEFHNLLLQNYCFIRLTMVSGDQTRPFGLIFILFSPTKM